MTRIRLNVNGQPVEVDVAPRTNLADTLREHLALTGTHVGCEHGVCGACTVEINGEIARSCITYAVGLEGADVRTIEGFDDDPVMVRLRKAFSASHALQCGYCTPGMLIAARDLVKRRGRITRDEIRHAMSGNLCRCTGYMGIVSAIETVMSEVEAEAPAVAADSARWLGPVPGPAPEARQAAPQSPRRTSAPAVATAVRPVAKARQRTIAVEMSRAEALADRTRLRLSFVLAHPIEKVWELFRDPVGVSRSIPGLTLEPTEKPGHFLGTMEVALGVISARFKGEGQVQVLEAERRQHIEGRGTDRGSGSMASGGADFSLKSIEGAAGGPATRVDAVIDYAISGPLAQFGRSSLIEDVMRRITELFAGSVDARLAGDTSGEAAPRALGAGSLAWHVFVGRMRALLRRLGLG